MCGIVGVFDQGSGRGVDEDELRAMIAAQRHRGPDAQGVHRFAGGGFGHARLSIVDLRPESNQPFLLDDGALALTFNGEIFNFQELRAELEALGHTFRTSSDTEVLLHAYKAWGPACVRRFNGMWAFVIHDREKDLLFASRDRFGIKPFYWAQIGGRFLFSSEIKGLLAVERALAAPNHALLARFARSWFAGDPHHTFFERVFPLEPAHNLVVTRGGLRTERYWDYPTEPLELGAEEAAGRFRELLVDAIRLRLISDVPLGSMLSSGVDSSAIVCLLRSVHAGPHDTFTASYPGEAVDESPVAADLSARLAMTHHPIRAQVPDFLPVMRSIVRHLDAPNGDPGTVPAWAIFQEMRRTITVALEGQGADELLGGYERATLGPLLADAWHDHAPSRAVRTVRRFATINGWRDAVLWPLRSLAPEAHRYYRLARGLESVYRGPLAEAPALTAHQPPPPAFQDHLTTNLWRAHTGVLRTLLQRGDAISMAHSMEGRVPFMDYRLVELAFRLPGTIKCRDGVPKALLRDAVRGDVPAPILAPQRKQGFTTPIRRWFREEAERTVFPVLLDPACRRRGLLDPGALEAALRRHTAGTLDIEQQIFRWIGLELWFQEFIDA